MTARASELARRRRMLIDRCAEWLSSNRIDATGMRPEYLANFVTRECELLAEGGAR